SGGKIGEGQGIKKASLGLRTTMSDQIGFQKAGASLIPLLERANRNLLFEQSSRTRGGDAINTSSSLWPQEAICRSGTHREELGAASVGQRELALRLQGF